MSEKDALNNAWFSGPAHWEFQRGTSSMYGSTLDRGTDFGRRRYPKGLRANATGTAVLVSVGGNTVPVVLAAGQEIIYRFTAITATVSLTHGTSNIDNFVIIWD